MRRPHYTLKRLMLAVLIVGLSCGGVELGRRQFYREPEPPEWPWFPGAMNHFEITYINMNDVKRGIKPPRTRSILHWPKQQSAKPAQARPKPVKQVRRAMTLIPPEPTEVKP